MDIDFYKLGIAVKDIRVEEITDNFMSLREITIVITPTEYGKY